MDCVFSFLIVAFDMQGFFLMKSHLSIFFFCYLCFGVISMKFLQNNFMGLALIFRSLPHFELILYMMEHKAQLHSLVYEFTLAPALVEKTVLTPPPQCVGILSNIS
jgi:hypothetical protein